ncbi:MAG: glycosyltransferase family 4 protein [bacterium]|nr:glycosyltransferase family 4 protein [bacterium]
MKLTAKMVTIQILDLICAVLLFPFAVVYVLQVAYLRPKKKNEKGSLLHLSSGASTNDALNKFGSLDFLFNYDGDATENLFQKNILFWFPSKNSLCLHFSNGWIILEQRRALGVLLITGLLLYLIRVIHIVQVENVRMVRGWDPYFNGFIAWLISSLLRLPFCVSIHADYDLGYKLAGAKGRIFLFGSRRLAKILEKFVLSHTKMVMPKREYLGQQAVMNGANPKAIRVIPFSINMTPFKQPPNIDIYEHFELNRNLKILSFVGRLVKENYVDDIMVLARMMEKLRDDSIIVMAGGGNQESMLRKLVNEDTVLNRVVRLVGFQPHEICLDLRRASTVSLCLMAGNSLVEACASGRPVIAYDVDWHYELVKDNETGFLVKEGDVQTVAEKINYLLNHRDDAERMGENAKQLAFERHDIQRTSAIQRQCYEELLETSRVRPKNPPCS